MKSKLHSLLIYPLLFMFSYLLKGRKENYDNFICLDKKELKNLSLLHIKQEDKKLKNKYYDEIKYFFDKKSALYDKTLVELNISLDEKPEDKKIGIFDFSKEIDMYYSASMLSSRITNDNIYFELSFFDTKLDDDKINIFLRYCLLIYASRKVDKFFIEKKLDKKTSKAFDFFTEITNASTIVNFSKSKDLYVITCKKNKQTLDIIWSSTNREIELTEFNKVYDKFGELIDSDVKISQNPIYAYHK